MLMNVVLALPQDRGSSGFAANSRVVVIPTTVLDKAGATVTGLKAEAFTVIENRRPQTISYFGEQDVPASLGIVFDVSGSMVGILPDAKALLKALFEQCNPLDEAFVYTVSSRPALVTDFTDDLPSLPQRVMFSAAYGATALTDTIFAAVRKSRFSHNPRKVIVIVSDGMDNHSRYSKSELMATAVEADVQIYSLSLFTPGITKKPIEMQEEREGVAFLRELSDRTGGIQAVIRSRGEVEAAAASIGRARGSGGVLSLEVRGRVAQLAEQLTLNQ